MADWSGEEVGLIVADYFDILSPELPGASPDTANNNTYSSHQKKARRKERF
jgi:hypothetical protein